MVVSCVTDEDSQYIEAELKQYMESFETEALLRNREINISDLDLSAYVKDIETRGTLGQCKTYASGRQEVVIDENFWSEANYLEKEYIIFHELGHCVLDRNHKNDEDEKGNCTSLMQSGNSGCNGVYTSSNRSLLLDELFNN